MLSSILIIVLIAEAFARPDVSHLLTKNKQSLTSYDVPVSSINSKYASSTHTYRKEPDVPSINYLPPFIVPVASNSASGSGIVGVSQGQVTAQQPILFVTQVPNVVSGGNSVSSNQFVSSQGQSLGGQIVPGVILGGTSVSGNQLVSNQGQSLGGQIVPGVILGGTSTSGNQFVSSVGQSPGNVQYVSQVGLGQGHGQGNVHFVSQVNQGGVSSVSQGGQGHVAAKVVNNKERVYFFSAPDEEHHARLRINIVPTHTKNTNVIFVKAPSSGKIIPEVIVPPHQIIEDKTKVVVLVKENEHYVPISVPAPLPISHGKAEVLVVKYHDKNDAARIVHSGGNVVGTTVVHQLDKPSFINTVGSVQYGNVGTLLSRSSLDDANIDTSSATSGISSNLNVEDVSKPLTGLVKNTGSSVHSVEIVSETPKILTDFVSSTSADKQNIEGNLKLFTVDSGNVGITKTGFEIVGTVPIVQSFEGGTEITGSSGAKSSTGGSYEIKSVGISDNAGTQFANNADVFNVRFSDDSSVKTTEIGSLSQSLESGSLDQLKKLLGSEIEIVGISTGVLEGSAAGANAQDEIFKSLGISGESGQAVSGFEIKQGRSEEGSFSQLSTEGIHEGTKQIKIGNDVADVISGSSLNP